MGGEGVVDPVDKEDTKVKGGELSANVCLESVILPGRHLRFAGNLQTPRLAFGENSACRTGTVELMKPMPTPDTMRATIK